MWKHSSSREYRVKQACSLIHKDQTREVSEGLNNTPIPEGIWKLVWRVKLPIRILTFIWRILPDSVPVFTTVNRRGIQTSTRCMLCDADEESSTHLFLKCTFARVVWHGSNLGIRTTAMHYVTLRLLGYITTNSLTGKAKMELLQALFTILWMLWNNRNMVLHKGQVPNPLEVVLTSQTLICRYREAFNQA